jgi:branched-subunit amino acid permease
MWSGGMIAVLIGKFVGAARGCVPAEGLPACDWYLYAAAGMILGAVTLPLLVLRRLSKRK